MSYQLFTFYFQVLKNVLQHRFATFLNSLFHQVLFGAFPGNQVRCLLQGLAWFLFLTQHVYTVYQKPELRHP